MRIAPEKFQKLSAIWKRKRKTFATISKKKLFHAACTVFAIAVVGFSIYWAFNFEKYIVEENDEFFILLEVVLHLTLALCFFVRFVLITINFFEALFFTFAMGFISFILSLIINAFLGLVSLQVNFIILFGVFYTIAVISTFDNLWVKSADSWKIDLS